jgi:hypothetical protein
MKFKMPSKYELYEASVMDAPEDVKFFRKLYREIFTKEPFLYREDFCGTFCHSSEWVKLDKNKKAWALDRSRHPLAYGMKAHFSKLATDQKKRLQILKRDVFRGINHKVDLITVMNFSYCFLKQRELLKKYFKGVYQSLKPKGLFLMDACGGTEMQSPSVDKSKIPRGRGNPPLIYYWEQKNFDAITFEANFAIHFQYGKRKMKNAFTYDWRMWTLPEIQDLLYEVGFKKVHIYWEGNQKNGEGNGIFKRRTHQENCEVWIAYVAAVKN